MERRSEYTILYKSWKEANAIVHLDSMMDDRWNGLSNIGTEVLQNARRFVKYVSYSMEIPMALKCSVAKRSLRQ